MYVYFWDYCVDLSWVVIVVEKTTRFSLKFFYIASYICNIYYCTMNMVCTNYKMDSSLPLIFLIWYLVPSDFTQIRVNDVQYTVTVATPKWKHNYRYCILNSQLRGRP